MIPKVLLAKFQHNMNLTRFVFFTFIVLLPSCVTQRKLEYLHVKNEGIKIFSEPEFPDYTLKPNDELYIKINSLDEGAANIFSNEGGQSAGNAGAMDSYSASLMSYSVNKDGYLLLPVIGNIFVKDKTLSEVSLVLRDSLSHILNQPVVNIKLVNRYITVLGEVRNPGHFNYTQEKLTIYTALG